MIGIRVGLRLNARHQYLIQVCVTLHQTAHLGITKTSLALQLIKSILNLPLGIFGCLSILLLLVFQELAYLFIEDGRILLAQTVYCLALGILPVAEILITKLVLEPLDEFVLIFSFPLFLIRCHSLIVGIRLIALLSFAIPEGKSQGCGGIYLYDSAQ